MRTPERLTAVIELLARKAEEVPIFFVTDAVSSAAITDLGLRDRMEDGLREVPKLAYFEFVTLLRGASFVVTDSGGLQEECAYLNIPCLVHRGTTERPDGLGRNVVLSGMDLRVVETFLEDPSQVHQHRGRVDDLTQRHHPRPPRGGRVRGPAALAGR